MKMKKMIYFMFALLLLSANSMNAQVAIGSQSDPRTGAILDLQGDGTTGLLLPKVTLTDTKRWAPVVGEKADEVDGMMVFNDNTSTENGLDGKGVYVWVNGSWNKIKTPVVIPPPFTQGDPEGASICYGTTATFQLAEASGGSGNITYIWQQRTTEDGIWEQATGTFNEADYTTPLLTSNRYYRRTATASVSGGTIESNSALVTVYEDFTQANLAAAIVCQGLTTKLKLAEATGGSGAITYNWQQRPNTTSEWGDATGTRNEADYTTPATLTANMYFRRKAIDAECEPIYSNSALVTVISFSQANPADADVCYGGTTTINPGVATGGSGEITYNWQQRPNTTSEWKDADGTCTNAAYTTPALKDDMYYRRLAKCDCGTIESNSAKITVSKPNGEPVTGKSGFIYDTYSYPNSLGVWTANVKEAGYAATTYGLGTADEKAPGERGYYYAWANAAAACSDLGTDWALPTKAQWEALKTYFAGQTATDDERHFFTCGDALAGRYRHTTGIWDNWGIMGAWWGSVTNYLQYTNGGVSLLGPFTVSSYYYSVRCVKPN